MNRVFSFLLVACLLPCLPEPVAAASGTSEFPGCGTVTNRNNSYQFGQFNWIEYIVESSGAVDICGQWVVHVEANVVGVANSGQIATGIMYASVRRQVPVPAYNRLYQTSGTATR
jgi:hypothetical protein